MVMVAEASAAQQVHPRQGDNKTFSYTEKPFENLLQQKSAIQLIGGFGD